MKATPHASATQTNHSSAKPFVQSAPPPQLSHEAIATRAYELFIERGSVDGQHDHDWAMAEKELRSGAPRRSLT